MCFKKFLPLNKFNVSSFALREFAIKERSTEYQRDASDATACHFRHTRETLEKIHRKRQNYCIWLNQANRICIFIVKSTFKFKWLACHEALVILSHLHKNGTAEKLWTADRNILWSSSFGILWDQSRDVKVFLGCISVRFDFFTAGWELDSFVPCRKNILLGQLAGSYHNEKMLFLLTLIFGGK